MKELLYKLQSNPDASNKSVIQEGIKEVEACLKEFYRFEDNLKNILNQNDGGNAPSDTLGWVESTIENMNDRIEEARTRTDATKKRRKGGKAGKMAETLDQLLYHLKLLHKMKRALTKNDSLVEEVEEYDPDELLADLKMHLDTLSTGEICIDAEMTLFELCTC